jgi:hypothetical protein
VEVGIVAVLCTILIHALAVGVTVNLFRREKRLGRAGASYGDDLLIVIVAILVVFGAHLMEIAIWAMVFILCGELSSARRSIIRPSTTRPSATAT